MANNPTKDEYGFEEEPTIKAKPWIAILRWMGVIPFAVVAYVVARLLYILITWLGNIFGAERLFTPGSLGDRIIQNIVIEAIGGVAFVYFGSVLAPKYRGYTAIGLAGLLILISGASLLAIFMQEQYSSILGVISMNVASIITCIRVFNEEKEELV
jgi:hypothetical protein